MELWLVADWFRDEAYLLMHRILRYWEGRLDILTDGNSLSAGNGVKLGAPLVGLMDSGVPYSGRREKNIGLCHYFSHNVNYQASYPNSVFWGLAAEERFINCSDDFFFMTNQTSYSSLPTRRGS